MSKGPFTGARIAPAMASVLAQTLKAHETHTGPHKVHLANQARTAFLEELERELAPFVGPMFDAVHGDPDAPDWLKAMVAELRTPTNQATAILEIAAEILSIFAITGAITSPLQTKFRQNEFHLHQYAELAPEEWALSVIKGETSEEEAAGHATYSGIDGYKFGKMVRNVGEPLALQELLYLLRRGHINEARFEHGVRQSRTRDEWIDAARALEFVPISAGEAVTAVLKGHLTHDQGRKIFTDNGIEGQWFDAMVHTAGRPPGPMEMLTLFNRGKATKAHVEQAIRQSDVNNDYMNDILELAVNYPPPRSVPALVKSKAITRAEGHTLLKYHGYPDHLADAVLNAITHEKAATTHHLSAGEVKALYEGHLIDKTRATKALELLKYDAAAIAETFDLWDHARELKETEVAIHAVRARYVARHTDRPAASAALDQLHVATAERDQLIRLWDMERVNTSRQLTEAQIVAAVRRGVKPPEWAIGRLEALGLNVEDATILLQTVGVLPVA